MIGLIARGARRRREVRRIAEAAAGALPLDSVRLLAPIRRPGKIMAIGLNYADHIAESGAATPERQIWFSKASTAAHGPFDRPQLPKASHRTDYEAELVAVIGGAAATSPARPAPAAVFGYCVRQRRHRARLADAHHASGCSASRSTPTRRSGRGSPRPTRSPTRTRCRSAAFVNGEVRQESNTRHLVFDVWDADRAPVARR